MQNSKFIIQHSLGLFLTLAAFFVLTMGGHTYSRDEETMFVTSEALARNAHFTLPSGLPVVDTIKLSDGSEVSKYGPLKSLLQLPLYWLGNAIAGGYPDGQHGFITRLYVSIFNPLVQAAIAALLFLFATGLGYRRRAALLVALLYAFATFSWPHSRTQFAEPLSALLMFASLYFAWRGTSGSGQQGVMNHAPTETDNVGAQFITPDAEPMTIIPHSSLLTPHFVSGLLLAAALATKFQNLIVFPIIFVYVFWLVRRRGGSRWWLGVIGWLAGFVIGYLPLGLYNSHFFGGFFSSGYGDASGIKDIVFAIPMNQGLYDLLLSPGKGLLWFAPPVMLLPFAIPLAWRRNAALTSACVATVLVHILFYSMNRFWHGDGSWGPRYLMPALPFALLPVAALIERLWPTPQPNNAASRPARSYLVLLPGRAAVMLLAAFGVTGQLFGSAVNFDSYINQTYQDNSDSYSADTYRYFTVEGSPLLGHVWMLADRWREWQPNLNPPADAITFASGFSISEGNGGAPLPRWTTGAGIIKLSAPSPFSLTLILADHRPPPLPRAQVQVISDYGSSAAREISGAALPDGVSKQYHLDFAGPGQQSRTVAILSDTWNPALLGIPRDETIGIDLTSLQPSVNLPVVGAAVISMPQHSAKQRFDWFYRPDYHHLLDHWRWYVAYSGLSPTQQDGLANSIYMLGGIMLILGLICFLPLRRA
ncbi:MAG: hypothetical protein DLM69_08610 [Candidatus Chloroheliales bacterium]|nr:MAG: hypothetical protein DLM69_08610 [Chloroflexota bacterium]